VQAWRCDRDAVVGRLLHVLEVWPEANDSERSWCGGAEAGLVGAAPVRKEGVKARRKRKAADNSTTPQAIMTTARWASSAARRQEFRYEDCFCWSWSCHHVVRTLTA
jgi:hypothetical protein